MSNTQLKPTDITAIIGVINPVSTATTVNSGWIDISNFHSIEALVTAGVLGTSATVDAKIQQASSSSGTGAKDVTGKSITQLVKATDDNKLGQINLFASELDLNNGFRWVQLSITVGVAASLVSGHVIGFAGRYDPASDSNIAGVKSIT